MAYSSTQEIFDAFNNLKILVIGDVMIDSYLWGKVNRISPEAPVPVVDVQKREWRLGGAANVALNLQSLGATPVLRSVIGDDADADTFVALMEEEKLDASVLIRSEIRKTTIKHRIMSGSHHLLRVDSEQTNDLSAKESTLLLQAIDDLLDECDAVLFEDYNKGVLTAEVIAAVIDKAKTKGIPTIVDPKKNNFLAYEGVTLFKPNLRELKEGLKLDSDLKELEELQAAVETLKTQMHVEGVLTTLSERGVFINYRDERKLIPTYVREISDVSGAGDTVVSVASLCVALNLPPSFIAGLSNLAGGLVCEYTGVVPIDKTQLLAEAEKNSLFTSYVVPQ